MKNAKCAENINHSFKYYYITLVLKSIAIAMPHAFLTLIFLDKGMDYSKIAIIQAFYSLGVVLFEYPSGVLADKYSKKNIYLVSSLLLIVSYFMILNTNEFLLLIIAWFVYGISTAMETGTIDADLIVWIKESCDKDSVSAHIGKFVGKSGQISSISAICGACIGFVLYKIIDINIYWIMMLLVFSGGLVIMIFFNIPSKNEESRNRSITMIVKESIKEIRDTKELRYMLLLFALFQVFLQVHYQLWQSLFLDYGVDQNWFIFIYLIFQFISVLAYKVPVNALFKKTSISIGISTIIATILMYCTDNAIVKMILYIIPVCAISLAVYYTEIKYNEIVNTGNISSITSLLSTGMRLFGFVTLIVASKFIALFSIRVLFLIVPISVIIAVCFVLDRYVITRNVM